MTSKSGKQPAALDLKALYEIVELCRFAEMSRYRLWRVLERRGVKCIAARRRDERLSRTTESSARMESVANRERFRALRR